MERHSNHPDALIRPRWAAVFCTAAAVAYGCAAAVNMGSYSALAIYLMTAGLILNAAALAVGDSRLPARWPQGALEVFITLGVLVQVGILAIESIPGPGSLPPVP